jgi:hypothetical protein
MEATKDNNQFQFGGMTLNIWIENNLPELLMASQTGTISIFFFSFRRYSQPMYTSRKLFPGVIDTIPSDNNTKGHTFDVDITFFQDLDVFQEVVYMKLHVLPCWC